MATDAQVKTSRWRRWGARALFLVTITSLAILGVPPLLEAGGWTAILLTVAWPAVFFSLLLAMRPERIRKSRLVLVIVPAYFIAMLFGPSIIAGLNFGWEAAGAASSLTLASFFVSGSIIAPRIEEDTAGKVLKKQYGAGPIGVWRTASPRIDLELDAGCELSFCADGAGWWKAWAHRADEQLATATPFIWTLQTPGELLEVTPAGERQLISYHFLGFDHGLRPTTYRLMFMQFTPDDLNATSSLADLDYRFFWTGAFCFAPKNCTRRPWFSGKRRLM